MSRTYRRKGIKNPWPRKTEISSWSGKIRTWGYLDWEWHNDKTNWETHTEAWKWHTNWLRRADERKLYHDLKNDPETDFTLNHKRYKALWWNYD